MNVFGNSPFPSINVVFKASWPMTTLNLGVRCWRWVKIALFCMHVRYKQWAFLSHPLLSRWCKSMINDWSIRCPGFESQWQTQKIFVFLFLIFFFLTYEVLKITGNLQGRYVFYCNIFYNVHVRVLTNRARIV